MQRLTLCATHPQAALPALHASRGWRLAAEAVQVFGVASGALGGGALADAFGRARVLLACAALFVPAFAVAAAAEVPAALVVGRFAASAAAGGVLVTAPLLLAELAPAARRGAFATAPLAGAAAGALAACAAAAALAAPGARQDDWRLALACPAVAAALVLALAAATLVRCRYRYRAARLHLC